MAEGNDQNIEFSSTQNTQSQTITEQQESQVSLLSTKSSVNKETRNENRSRSRHLWNVAVESVLEHEKFTPNSTSMTSSTNNKASMGWYNLTKRVMQLNTSPLLATAAAPAIHKDTWQQRRYNFLSKYSVFGGELKDDVVDQIGINEQGTDIEQRPIIQQQQTSTSGSMDFEPSTAKRGSILGMAVSGVRNLLSEQEENQQLDDTDISLKNITGKLKANQQDLKRIELAEINENDDTDAYVSNHRIQTENDRISSPTIVPAQISTTSSQGKLNVSPKEDRFSRLFSYFSCSTHESSKQKHKKLAEIHESYRSHRPYFTYWVTFVQIFVCVISLIVYGNAPLSSIQSKNSSIFKQQKSDLTINLWFGPYPADLIRLGAKYTPCIRSLDEVRSRYEKQATLEAVSGCCIDLKTGFCMQTLSEQCLPRAGLTWYGTPIISKDPKDRNNVIYPAVCGLTPETCTKRLISNTPREDDSYWPSTFVNSKMFKWSPNPIKWPICLEQDYSRIANNLSLYPHMQCKHIARPCCTGVLGDCILTSRGDCRRRRGIYHPKAHLCSQVDCIQNVCGMLEFFVARVPDQVYRFWTVIFIHAGIIHLIITIIFQYTIMRPLEKLAGCIRVMIIYIVSGFVGSLASALFLRDSVQVGPGGGQFAILACYLSELFLGWRSLKRPWIPFFKIIICLFLLFTVGLLPLVDNYSQCFGFIIGFILNMIVFPDVNYKKNSRRLVVITAALATTIVLFIVLITLFYTIPFECTSCKLFECPFGKSCRNDKYDSF